MGEHSLKKSEAPRSLPRREKIQIALQINFCYRDGWYEGNFASLLRVGLGNQCQQLESQKVLVEHVLGVDWKVLRFTAHQC